MALEFRIQSEYPVKVSGRFLGLGSAAPRSCVWTELERRNRVQVRDGESYYDAILVDTRGRITITVAGADLIREKRLLLRFSPDKRWDDWADFEDDLDQGD